MIEAIRTAVAADLPRLDQLLGELVDSIGAQRGGSLLLESDVASPGGHHQLGDLLSDVSALVLVGTLDEVVTGLAVCHISSQGAARPRGVLDACYVESGARGVGLGRLLLDATVSWMEERGCQGADGIALPGDRGAKNFYESAGFKARMLTMYREIDPAP